MNKQIYLGNTALNSNQLDVDGRFIDIQGEKFYKISNYNYMPDFFMTIVSDSDHWLFISSNGSLSAGRKDRDNALFPYYTVDKIHDYCGITGSKSILQVEKADKVFLWEPFSKELAAIYNIERNLYKSEYGNNVIFEEINHDLEVTFKYGWYFSEEFGFVKKSFLLNHGADTTKIELLDGITNLLPTGVDYNFQNEYSNLLDGYKKNELIEDTGLGLFMLSSIPVDKAEPSESLNATTVWSSELPNKKIILCNKQIQNFRNGYSVETELDIKGNRGSYFVNTQLELEQHQEHHWMIVAEINQDSSQVANLNQLIQDQQNLTELVNTNITKGTAHLIQIVGAADGLQSTNEELCYVRHYSNTLFNIMRGGTYLDNYEINTDDLKKFVVQRNQKISIEFTSQLNQLPATVNRQALIEFASDTDNAALIRICYEYLPLTFSRRHGDPSRPWNLFSIDNKEKDGTPKSDYQGNWRDIFQNWEALCLSYPEYIESIISKFVNATTADGYNPYRIMREGIDWESPDEDDPWAYIGYWGDHQIIYLQKLLELSDQYHPGKLNELLGKDIFAYANVPYRIKPYSEIIKDPSDTIEFDHTLNTKIRAQVIEHGADSNLLTDAENNIYHVNLTEKILVTLLAKLCNFIPEAGIWLNTQRPEWNDANNALVGNGTSMVTMYYLRRFLKFWNNKFSTIPNKTISVSEEVATLFDSINSIFSDNSSTLNEGFSEKQRRHFCDLLGETGTAYRNKIYTDSFSGDKEFVATSDIVAFTQLAIDYIDQSIKVNKREDGLYHAYNLISINDESITIRHLYEMLEGQVAILSSGYLSVEESHNVLDALKSSQLFTPEQYSYLLYPNRELPRFDEKNNIPVKYLTESKLLSALITENNSSIITVDESGTPHFCGDFRNEELLSQALDSLNTEKYGELLSTEKAKVLSIYEEIFQHHSYTGRSGTFFAYEGLGSIYWHMVSKLLLVVEETYFQAVDEASDPVIVGKAGIGLYKTPKLYGAFPTDPYSHTPGNAGAKQPGMTGQVKEDFLTRMGCLGVRINQGEINFDSRLINHKEFFEDDNIFNYVSIDGNSQQLNLKNKQLGFTLCQIPVVYTLGDHENIMVTFKDDHQEEFPGNSLNQQISSLIFNRENEIKLLQVSIR
jgi:hypothetical protein